MMRSNPGATFPWMGLLLAMLCMLGCADRQRPSAAERMPRAERDTSDTATARGNWIDSVEEPVDSTKPDTAIVSASRNITVQSPKGDTRIEGNGFLLKGTARTFENALSYRLTAGDGGVLAAGHLTSNGEMGSFNPYSIRVTYRPGYHGGALLEVFQHSAKDGAEIDKVSIPIQIVGDKSGEENAGEMTLNVYFTNSGKGTSNDCRQVFPVARSTARTVAVAEIALRALVDGPTQTERKLGYGTALPAGTRVVSVTIAQGHATADFSAELGRLSGSCTVTAARAQIEQTLRQFPTVKSVTISVNGKKEALQP